MMRKLMINILTGMLAAALLAGCAKTESGQRETENIGSVVVRREEEKEEKKTDRKAEKDKKTDSEESILDEAEIFEDKEDELTKTESGTISIVVGGFRLQIPKEYGCFIDESKGPIVYRDDLFTMLINVREDSYRERMEEPDSLMDGAKKIGGEITKEIEEVKIGGKPYAWFTYFRNGDNFLVIFTPAADSDKRLCAQLLIEGDDVSEKELLERFDGIAKSAEATGEPDTTQEALAEARILAAFGEEKKESTLNHQGTEITFQVEPGFYSQFAEADEYWACEFFAEPSDMGTVDCFLEPVSDERNAKTYIETEMEFAQEKGEIYGDTVKVNGHIFYYYFIKYEHDGSSYQKMVAASDVTKGYMYVVKVNYIDAAVEIEPEDFMEFFYFD